MDFHSRHSTERRHGCEVGLCAGKLCAKSVGRGSGPGGVKRNPKPGRRVLNSPGERKTGNESTLD